MLPRGAKLNGRGRVIAFDPQTSCLDDLARTIAANGWQRTLETVAVGLGDHDAEAELHLSGTGSSFDAQFNAPDSPTAMCPIRTLDGECRRLGVDRVDFIKIDVEGFELPVLDGAVQTIRRDRPVLFIEIADSIRGRDYQNPRYGATIGWLQQQGYRVFRCREDARLESVHDADPQPHINMYLCVDANEPLVALYLWALLFRMKEAAIAARRRAWMLLGMAFSRLPPGIRAAIKRVLGRR